jgi:hypothetical protein
MSGEIDNRAFRQRVLKELIALLHEGKSVDEVKERFAAAFDGVSAEEIAQAEQALIAGGLPVAEVQRLCDVHAAVFKGSIEEIHADVPADIPGIRPTRSSWKTAPLTCWRGRSASSFSCSRRRRPEKAGGQAAAAGRDRPPLPEEGNLLFPYLEKYGITAPPKVMWGVDDEIRAQLRRCRRRGGHGRRGAPRKD